MKKIIILVLTSFLSLLSPSAHACSVMQPTIEFIVDENREMVAAIAPSFSVASINRGKEANHSCSGFASLKLKLESPMNTEQGYLFEIETDNFKKIKFRDHAVTPTKYVKDESEFVFYYNEITNEPIDITLKITAVSKSGAKSQAQLLKITHSGTHKPPGTRKPPEISKLPETKKSLLPTWSQKSR